MARLYNLARMSTATTGTGTIALGSAVSGYLSFSGAGVSDGDVVSYGISDGTNSEVGTGTYTASGTTLTRSVTVSTNSNAAISLSGTAEVYITALAEDLLPLDSIVTPEANGAAGDGTTDDTTALAAAFTAANGKTLLLTGTYLTDPFTIGSTNCPARIISVGGKIKQGSGTAATVTIENPQSGTGYKGLEFSSRLIIDANSKGANGLRVHGLQDTTDAKAVIDDITVENSTGIGIDWVGEPSYGIYGVSSRGCKASSCGGQGMALRSINNGTDFYVQADLIENAQIQGCVGGMYVDYAGATVVNLWGESNTGAGVDLFHTQDIVFIGGHLESNNISSVDTSFQGAAGSSKGVHVYGTRTTGAITGLYGGEGNVILPCAIGYAGKHAISGTVTNDDAPAGCIGEYVASDVESSSALSATSGTVLNVTSVSLTAGDWDVVAHIYTLPNATTNTTVVVGSLSETSATLNTFPGAFTNWQSGGVVTGGGNIFGGSPAVRMSLSATTTLYLVGLTNFTVSTSTLYGSIQARRVR